MKDKGQWNNDPEYLIKLINEYYQWMATASTHNYNNTHARTNKQSNRQHTDTHTQASTHTNKNA